MRDRLLLCRDLLHETGSCFIQISDENLNYIRDVAAEVFGAANYCGTVSFIRGGSQTSSLLAQTSDYLVWFAKNKEVVKFRRLYIKDGGWAARSIELFYEDRSGQVFPLREKSALPDGCKLVTHRAIESATGSDRGKFVFEFNGKTYAPIRGWSTTQEGMEKLRRAGRLMAPGKNLRFKVYLDDFPYSNITASWTDTISRWTAAEKIYVVETAPKVVQRCMLMTTDPGDLVLDPTCGSGTTAFVAEQWGRRWITCDTSRVAVSLAKQRLMTSTFPFYRLLESDLGIDGGLDYNVVDRPSLRSIVYDEPDEEVTMYDDPKQDTDRVRVTGPFTIEAVPAPMNAAFVASRGNEPDGTIGRSGATARETDWRDELLKTGVRGLGGKIIKFSRVEPLAGTSFLHAEAETVEEKPQRVVISFGPAYAPLEQRQVEGAWQEARNLDPKPSIVLFAAFQFDPEAAKDIDEMPEAVTKRTTFLKVQMNTDMLTGDLKKKRAANESFWLVGRPDVELRKVAVGEHKDKYLVEVHGFDYYDVKTGEIISGNASKIAMWMLDTNYDERSLFPRQVFFPMSGEKDGWSKLAKNLKAEIDEELIETYRGTVSIPFDPGENKRVAVKIIDDRGVESMRVLKVQ
jgi:adenine-specific DNA-methyltransferase